METVDIAGQRLYSQHIKHSENISPAALVSLLGVVQAQDYNGSKWSIGLRLTDITDKYVEDALKSKKIVRTWANRGTLQFVNASDVLWMLELLAPILIKRNARRYRELGLDEQTFIKSENIFEDVLEGSDGIKRSELRIILEENGVSTDGQRFAYILQRASLDGYMHQGIAIKNDPVYHSMNKFSRIDLNRNESLEEISKRYFYSHGPATLKDFVWWSGLAVNDAKIGLESIKSELKKYEIGDKIYWFRGLELNKDSTSQDLPVVKIIPTYDDFLLGYKDRKASINEATKKFLQPKNVTFSPTIIVDGVVIGTWKRRIQGNKVFFKLNHFRKLNALETASLNSEIGGYCKFIDKECGDIENL